ncbi:sickle tail protein homolog isoform X2 [Amphiura filiformis]|uniref:sickle tail protein homolog isoform X2 n=1 Tax=Amphiura filiformis TaxID=82378 RepID=UPI003B226831
MQRRTKPGLRGNPEYSSNGVKNKNRSQEEPTHCNEEVVRLRREIARNSDRRHTLGISHDVHARKQDRFKLQNSSPVTNGFHDSEEAGTMSETDTLSTGFKRGARYRSSLPIVRPRVNMSKEKPLGLIYLQYMNETKRALMPNEVTGIDTVRALFVRAFARKLTMNMLEAPERKIYIRDPVTEIFYELEYLSEIQDRTVLKIYEPGFIEDANAVARSCNSTPIDLNYYSEPELELDYPDTRRNRFHTMSGGFLPGSAPRMAQEEVIRPNSTTPLEMGRVMQQDPSFLRNSTERSSERPRPSSSIDSFLRTDRSNTNNVPRPASAMEVGNFQRGTLERSSERIMRPNQDAFQRGGVERSSERVQRPVSAEPIYQRPPNRAQTLPAQMSPDAIKMYQPHPNTSAGNTKASSTASTSQSSSPADGSQPDGPIQSPQRGNTSPSKAPLSPSGIAHRRDIPAQRSPSRDPYGRPVTSRADVLRSEMAHPYASTANKTQTLPARPGSRQKGPPPPTRTTPVAPPEKPQRTNGESPYATVISNRQATTGVAQPTRRTPAPGTPSTPVARQGQVGVAQARPVSQPILPGGLREPDIVAGQRSNSSLSLSSGRSTPMTEVETQSGGQPMRIMAMEQQIANLAGMVRSALSPSQTNGEPPQKSPKPQPPHRPQYDSGFSDITGFNEEIIQATQAQTSESAMDERSGKQLRPPNEGTTSTSVTPQPMAPFNTLELQNTAATLTKTAKDLREQLQLIRKLHLNMAKEMNDSFRSTANRVKLAMETNPGSNEHPLRKQRTRVHQDYLRYVQGKDKIDRELRALEAAVEEVRNNVVNKHSKVNIKEVDKLAQALGNSSRHIAEQKAMFPRVADNMKAVMSGEMNIVVQEESFLKNEPGKLDEFLKRCKKLTGTLFTLKRLASVQDHRPNQPTMVETNVTVTKEKEVLLERVANRPAIQARGTPTQSKMFTPPPSNNVQTVRPKTVDQLQSRKHVPSSRDTYDIVQFTQDLISGRCCLRTTGYLNAHNQRQKKHLWEMYSQEVHDMMTPIVTPEKAARRGSPSKGRALPPPPPKRTYTSQQAVANMTSSPTHQPSSVAVSGGGSVVKTTTTTHQNGKVVNQTGSIPELMSSSTSSVNSYDDDDSSRCIPKDDLVSKSTGSLLVQPHYHTYIIGPDFEKSKSQPALGDQSPKFKLTSPNGEIQTLNDSFPDCLDGHIPRQRVASVDSYLSVESALSSRSAPGSPRYSSDELGDRPPKPPRGCVEAPAALHSRHSPSSAFRPVNKSNWAETCLDNIPWRKQRHNSSGSDRSDGQHSMTSPNLHQGHNGYSPIKAEMAARLKNQSSPSHLPVTAKGTPPPLPQRQTEIRKNQNPNNLPLPQREQLPKKVKGLLLLVL